MSICSNSVETAPVHTYEDFEALLKSVKYPTAESAAPSNSEDTVDLPSPSTYEDTVDRTPPSSYADTPKRAEPLDLYSEYSPINLLFSILVTITIYSVPIFIYRYAIVKQPVEKRRAKLVTIVYGVIAFVVMCFLSLAINGSGASVGGSIVLWSMVNYKVLTGGKDRQVEEWSEGVSRTAPPVGDWQGLTPEADRISAPDLPEATRDSQTNPGKENIVFCHQCGAKLNRDHHFCYKCGAEIIK